MKAQIQDDDTLHIMAMRREKKSFEKGMTAKELWDALPELQPETTTFLKHVSQNVRSFTDRKIFKLLPEHKWLDILTYVQDE